MSLTRLRACCALAAGSVALARRGTMPSMAAIGATALLLLLPALARAEDPHARAVRLVAQMTLDEKLEFLQGGKHNGSHEYGNGSYVGIVPGLPRLSIPDLRMNDGPEGFRGEAGTSTQWPSGLTLARSWDPAAFLDWGAAMGQEFSGKGANVQFGPGANLARIPNGGRSFEYR
jgi:beta-glucosidase